jgi:hypothetical protein
MTDKEFQELTLGELEALTSVGRPRWCRYFNGKHRMREDILNRVAEQLGMTPGDLLASIAQRRQRTIEKKVVA